MIAVFRYTDGEIRQAVLEYHQKKIDFSTKNYKTIVNLEGEGSVSVVVESLPREASRKFEPIAFLKSWIDWPKID